MAAYSQPTELRSLVHVSRLFCICIAEAGMIANTTVPISVDFQLQSRAFSVFAVLFEVVSDDANGGLSLRYPTNATTPWTTHGSSKLVICVVMTRSYHRGLPYRLDRAKIYHKKSEAVSLLNNLE
ncbi:hypothetical protein F1880_003953 [Penicillium rolfsii]|nr:hypothetical protein F1880_003953 [Penicillium rolfsii]